MSDRETIEILTRQHVVIARMMRPQARNAVDAGISNGIEQALDTLEQSADLRVGVVSAIGPAFSAGADLKLMSQGRHGDMRTTRGGFAGITRRSRTKPVIAAVDGVAAGGGMEIALACDLIVASRGASFVLPEVKRSLIAGAGGVFRAPRSLPRGVALQMLLTGEPLSAERAYQLGLVVELCDPGEAESTAIALADRIAANAPLAVQAALKEVNAALPGDDAVNWERSDEAIARLRATEDFQEGPRAFLERRAPHWTGR